MEENQLAVIIGKNISARRSRLGFSQKEFSEKLEITPEAMARIEKGKIAPKMSRISDIASHLQCSVAYLFRLNNDSVEEKAACIVDIIKALPPDAQNALIDFMVSAVQVMDASKAKV